jgi:hypothetical protein
VSKPKYSFPAAKLVATHCPPDVVDRLEAAAEEDGLSKAAFVRTLIVKDLARRSRAQQGLPEHVDDPAALARVAELLDREPS